jgi:hypothetical protein
MFAEVHVTELTAVVLLLTLMGCIRVLLMKSLQDPFGVFLLSFGVFYAFRAVLIASGLDVPSPSYLFAESNVQSAYTRTTLGLCLFLVAFTGASLLFTRRPAASPGWMFHRGALSIGRLVSVTLLMTAFSVMVELYLLAELGSFGGIVRASKVEGTLAGLYLLKTPCGVGALVGTAAFLELRSRSKSQVGLRLLMLACAILNSILVFSWGQRGVLVIVVGMLMLVGKHRLRDEGSAPSHRNRNGHPLFRVALAAIVVVFLAVFLRDVRDNMSAPGQDHVFAEQSLARRASQGLNGTYFDASMLAYRDWPRKHEFRNGLDFYNGVAGAVPRRIWPGKPDPLPGKWFRQVYQPEIRNGWPVGSPTIWYLNFGWLGLIFGGLLSGAVIGHIARRYAAAPWSGMNVAMTFTLLVFVVPLGWASQTPAVWLKSALPLLLIMRFVTEVSQNKRTVSTVPSSRREATTAHASRPATPRHR